MPGDAKSASGVQKAKNADSYREPDVREPHKNGSLHFTVGLVFIRVASIKINDLLCRMLADVIV